MMMIKEIADKYCSIKDIIKLTLVMVVGVR